MRTIFDIYWPWGYVIHVIPETRRANDIWYLLTLRVRDKRYTRNTSYERYLISIDLEGDKRYTRNTSYERYLISTFSVIELWHCVYHNLFTIYKYIIISLGSGLDALNKAAHWVICEGWESILGLDVLNNAAHWVICEGCEFKGEKHLQNTSFC